MDDSQELLFRFRRLAEKHDKVEVWEDVLEVWREFVSHPREVETQEYEKRKKKQNYERAQLNPRFMFLPKVNIQDVADLSFEELESLKSNIEKHLEYLERYAEGCQR